MVATTPGTIGRRRFIELAGLGGLAGALGACTTQRGRGSSLTVLHDFEYVGKPGSMDRWWKAMLDRYAQASGNQTKSVSVAFQDLLPRIQTFNGARSGADLMTYYSNYHTFTFFFDKSLAPIGELVGQDELRHWRSKCRQFDGKDYFSPLFYENNVLVANKELCDRAGVDIIKRFASWEAFLAALDKVADQGVTPYLIGTSDNIQAGLLIDMFLMEVLNDPIETSEWLAGDAGPDAPVATIWPERLASLRRNGRINDDALRVTIQQAGERFGKGEAAFTNMFGGAAAALDPDKFAVIPFWQGSGPLSATMEAAGDGVFMTSYARSPEVAADFIKFLHQPEQLAAFYEATGEIPTDDRFTVAESNPLEAKIMELLKGQDPAPYWPTEYVPADLALSGFGSHATKLLRGEPADKVIDEFDAYLDRYRKTNVKTAETLKAFVAAVKSGN
jgi:raffinose/stachyose/melibiose transport system substrate-binding protein